MLIKQIIENREQSWGPLDCLNLTSQVWMKEQEQMKVGQGNLHYRIQKGKSHWTKYLGKKSSWEGSSTEARKEEAK